MATTTFEAVRTTQLYLIEGLTPTVLADVKFLRHREEQDFRVWCVENTQAAFRRFSIVDQFDYELPMISNTDLEFVEGREEVIISYPEDFRYGGDNLSD
jgi:asparagine synthetase B (glutamine-hydrolysing)